ncbi:lipoprotein [Streptomyces sp. NPDC060194]|uniref:lipoprotein n=1 Tax=Streptomyces sp. NPDC060194 TaxID=3347069 RepID=UPI00364C3880
MTSRHLLGTAATAALLLGLTACGGPAGTPAGKPEGPKATSGTSAASSPSPAAAKNGTVGAEDSPCPLPVTFATAPGWTAEAVETPDLTFGPFTLVCEIDAKPAGHVGFLRVWTGDGENPREALEAYLAEDAPEREDVETGNVPVGTWDATEVSYTVTSELDDEPKRERALAFTTPDGLVMLHLGGMDTAEHQAMLPALDLAERTLRPTA